jgi:hypothetical protein
MQRLVTIALTLGTGVLFVCMAAAQPPERREGSIRSQQAPPGGRDDGRDDGRPRMRPPPRWELGTLLPAHIQDELNLTEEQREQLQALEKEVKERVTKMLTGEQKHKLAKLRRREHAGPPRGGRGQPPDRGGRPDREGPPPEPPEDRQSRDEPATGAIQWFATWESGLKEAQRSQRPILLVSAAPHCAGVPGIW